jgi:hypothetical protein
MNKKQLLALAKELQVEVPDGATNKEIDDLIKIAEHPKLAADLINESRKLKEKSDECDTIAKELQTANEKIAELEVLLESYSKTKKETHGIYQNENGQQFEFSVKSFRYKGDKYNSQKAVEDSGLMEELIAAKVNFLKPQ